MEPEDPIALMARESRWRDGVVPLCIRDIPVPEGGSVITPESYTLRVEFGLAFHYERGNGVVVSGRAGVSDDVFQLYYGGCLQGAIAWINGFVPLHASAVCFDRRVHAFTGDSGAGKSTLAAALASKQTPLFADDTLILDIRDPDEIRCLPGHKRLKLWPDALEMVGIARGTEVFPDLDKYYAAPVPEFKGEPLPLAGLYFLESGDEMAVAPMSGTERIARLSTALYRPEEVGGLDRNNRELFEMHTRLCSEIPMSWFRRPLSKEEFGSGVDFMRDLICGPAIDDCRG